MTWSAPTAGWWPTNRESETTTGMRGGRASATGVAVSARMMTSPSIDWCDSRATAAVTSSEPGFCTSTRLTVYPSARAASTTASTVRDSPVRARRCAMSPMVPNDP